MLIELQIYQYQSFRVYQQHLQHLQEYQNLPQSLPSGLLHPLQLQHRSRLQKRTQ